MRPYLILLLALLFQLFIPYNASAQAWLWARPGTGGYDHSASVETDRLDNVVTISAQKFVNTTTYSNQITKFDRQGNVLWTKVLLSQPYTIGGFYAGVRSQAFDYDGNIYILSTNVRQYGDSIFTVTDTMHNVLKLDPNGELLWRKKLTSHDFALSHIVSNGKYDIYLNFQSRANTYKLFDSTYVHPAPGNTSRMFITRLDTSGGIRWTKIFYTSSTFTYFQPPSTTVNASNNLQNKISVNANNDILLGGVFYDTLNALGTVLIAPPITPPQVRKSGFLIMLDSTGARRWTRLIRLLDERNYIPDLQIFPNRTSAYQMRNLFQTIPIPPSGFTIVYNDTLVFLDSAGARKRVVNLRQPGDHFEVSEMDSREYTLYMVGRQFVSTIVNPQTDTTYMQVRRYDTTGALLWNKGLPPIASFKASIGGRISIGSDFAVTSGIINTSANSAAIFENDTIVTIANTFTPFVAAAVDSINLVSGRVYFDYNTNGVYDAGVDRPARFQVVRVTGGTARAITDTAGEYRLFVETGPITTSIQPSPAYYNTAPASHVYNFTNYGNNAANRDFVFTPATVANDLEIVISPLTGASWSRPTFLMVTYRNVGTTTLSGTVKVKLDSKAIYIDALPTPASITMPDSLSWTYTNLQPYETRTIRIHLTYVPQPTATPVTSRAWIDPTVGDQTPTTNMDTLRQVATGPYDPNNKLANPVDIVDKDSVAQNKSIIDYVINFQNTGSDTAFQVRVTDSLSGLLETNSFQLVATSHYCQPSLKNNVLEFYFPNIALPDSNVNERASHGFIHFRMRPKTTMTQSDTIFNKAAIYFDYNPPIITNRVKNYFALPLVTGINDPVAYANLLKVYPVPARSSVFYKLENTLPGNYTVRLFDLNGRLVYNSVTRSTGNIVQGELPITGLTGGTYILEVTGRSRVSRKMLLKL